MYSRAEKAMDTWATRGLITESGKAFLIATLDPFHDAQIENLTGYPDIETSPSIVRMVKQSITIAKPAGMVAGNWDCQIVVWPWMKRMAFRQSTARLNNMITTEQEIQQLGGLQALVCPSSVGNFDLNLVTTANAGNIELSDEILQGSNRLIGAGYEVHNTTAQIYKQGSVCNYMMHNVPKDSSLFVRPATTAAPPTINPVSSVFAGTSYRGLPRTTAEALLIPGSNEWEAADGVLSVCRFAGVENPPYTVDYNLPVLFETDDIPSSPTSSVPAADNNFPNTAQIIYPATALGGYSPATPAFKCFPIHTSGSIFTGLSEETTLRVNFNCIIENFPGPRDVKDLSIARPSAGFDPRTLEILSHTMGHAPVAVPVSENPLGEWFMDMVRNVSNAIGLIPHPIAQGISGVGKLIGDTFKGYETTPSGNQVVNKPKKKVKAVKAPPPRKPQDAYWGQKIDKPIQVVTNATWMKLSKAQRAEMKKHKTVRIQG